MDIVTQNSTGLQNYIEYEVAVAAQTAVGTGPYSIAQNFTTPEGGKYPVDVKIARLLLKMCALTWISAA